MTKKLHGKVRGRTIELDDDPGFADGQEVELAHRFLQYTGRLFVPTVVLGELYTGA
jgi:hypothetical protein